MDFIIKKGSTHPFLVMELAQNSYTDADKFFAGLTNSNITFSMKDADTGIYHLRGSEAECMPDSDNEGEYFIVYKFKEEDTTTRGTFIGEFNIDYNTIGAGNLIVPIREVLRIHII